MSAADSAPAPAAASSSSVSSASSIVGPICSVCRTAHARSSYSAAQLKKVAAQRKCAQCVLNCTAVESNTEQQNSSSGSCNGSSVQRSEEEQAQLMRQLESQVNNSFIRLSPTSNGNGLGLFSTRALSSDCILFEDPFLVESSSADEIDGVAQLAHKLLRLQKDNPCLDLLSVRAWNKLGLMEEEQRRMMSLRNDVDESVWQRAVGHIVNNFLDLGELQYVSLRLSFVNHSCEPNAVLTGNKLKTKRKIKAAEEITYNYLGEEDQGTYKQRKAELQGRWGFECRCALCLTKK